MLRDQVFALDHMFMSLFSTLGWMFRLAITAILLASIHPALVLLMVFALPAFWVSTWRPAVERRVEESVIANTRLARHLFVLGTTAPPAKEVRVTNTGDWLISERRAAWERYYEPVSKVRWVTAAWHTAAWAVFAGAYVAAIVYVASGLDRDVGDVVLVLAAGTRLARYVGATAGELGFPARLLARLVAAADVAGGLRGRASTRRRPPSAPERLVDGITFDHVSFRYPGTDHLVLDDISLHLPAGAVVAVVGENGAGKSTLVKLLARMYSPTVGPHHWSTVSTCPTSRPRNGGQRLAGAFQDFYRFELHAQQTVGVGDLPRVDDRDATHSAVDRAGAHDVIERLAYGIETQLGPSWDEGAEVSFGQWQKLALARGFMRDAPLLLILDEPTAALDAETEHALFERFAEASRAHADTGRLTVLVSHRFSTVRMADLIVVHGWLTRRRGRQPRRADGARRPVRGAVPHPGRRLRLNRVLRGAACRCADLPQPGQVAGAVRRRTTRRCHRVHQLRRVVDVVEPDGMAELVQQDRADTGAGPRRVRTDVAHVDHDRALEDRVRSEHDAGAADDRARQQIGLQLVAQRDHQLAVDRRRATGWPFVGMNVVLPAGTSGSPVAASSRSMASMMTGRKLSS